MMRHATLTLALCALALSTGCNALTTATKASNVISAVLNVAAAETQLVPPPDQAAYTGFVTLGQSLVTQLNACISAASGMSKSTKFLACFNGFSAGLASPAEMAQLRLLSPSTQSKVQLYLAGITAGINVAVAAFGGTQSAPPNVTAAPTKSAMLQLATDAHIPAEYAFYIQ